MCWPSLLLIGCLVILLAGSEPNGVDYNVFPPVSYPMLYPPSVSPPSPPPLRLDIPYSIYNPLLAAFFNWRQQSTALAIDPQSRSPPLGIYR